jgi:hypothetical protein
MYQSLLIVITDDAGTTRSYRPSSSSSSKRLNKVTSNICLAVPSSNPTPIVVPIAFVIYTCRQR